MRSAVFVAMVSWVAASLVGCNAEQVMRAAGVAPAASSQAAARDGGTASPRMQTEFGENDFIESDRNRDPFRSYMSTFAPSESGRLAQNQRAVVLPEYSIDEMRLVAIVTGGEYPRAMMVDPGGKGWILKRGDFVGRPEVVRAGGANGSDYQINWRVDRVREGDIVFTREDPAQPGVAPLTRVVVLHPEGDKDKIPD